MLPQPREYFLPLGSTGSLARQPYELSATRPKDWIVWASSNRHSSMVSKRTVGSFESGYGYCKFYTTFPISGNDNYHIQYQVNLSNTIFLNIYIIAW